MPRTLTALLFGGLLFAALPAFAQDFGGTGALTIVADPAYPTPGQQVTLTAESPFLDLGNSDIEWSVNGNPSASAGQSITVTAGGLGQETDVGVTVSGQSGDDSADITIIPTSIDLLWEADSYVPPFYQGRADATSGSNIRVLAIPHFVDGNGDTVLPSDINFTWKLNGGIDERQSGIGEDSAVFPAAILYGVDTITVDARTPDGSLSGESSISVRTQSPTLVLYVDDPLFGVMYHGALGQTNPVEQSETSFAAVPYFAAASSPNDASLAYAWSVNGSPVSTDPSDPSEITVSTQSSGTAQLALSVTKPSDPFFSAEGAWSVSFSASADRSGGNVFQSAQ